MEQRNLKYLRVVLVSIFAIVATGACTLNDGTAEAPPAEISGPPIVQIVSPIADASILQGTSVDVLARIENAGADIQQVELQINGEPFGESTNPNQAGLPVFSITKAWTPNEPGTYTITALANRSDGTASVPDVVTVNIVSAGSGNDTTDTDDNTATNTNSSDATDTEMMDELTEEFTIDQASFNHPSSWSIGFETGDTQANIETPESIMAIIPPRVVFNLIRDSDISLINTAETIFDEIFVDTSLVFNANNAEEIELEDDRTLLRYDFDDSVGDPAMILVVEFTNGDYGAMAIVANSGAELSEDTYLAVAESFDNLLIASPVFDAPDNEVVDNNQQPPANQDNQQQPPANQDNNQQPPANQDNQQQPPAVVVTEEIVVATMVPPSAEELQQPTAPPRPSNIPFGRILTGVNVRQGPGTTFATIGSYAADTETELLAVNTAGDWYKIRYYNGEGWVLASLISASGPLETLPVDAGPATPVPTPLPATQAPAPPPSNIDLSITQVIIDPHPLRCNEASKFTITVVNTGSEQSPGGRIIVRDVLNGQVLERTETVFPPLDPNGGQHVAEAFLTVSTNVDELHRTRVTVDHRNEIAESNENNNTNASEYILVRAGCP